MENLNELINKKGQKYIISKTARQNGFGCALWKTVSRLTPAERQYVKNGGIVVFNSGRLSGGNNGTTYRGVSYNRYGYKPYAIDGDLYGLPVKTAQTAEQKRQVRRKYYSAKKQLKISFLAEQEKIENSKSCSILEAIEKNLIDPRYKNHIDQDLLSEKILRLYNNGVFIFEAQLNEPAQWRLLQPRPHMPTGTLAYVF